MSRLESAIRNNPGADASVTEFADQLGAARSEITSLKKNNKVVSDRLDTAIGKMKTILGG